MAWKMHLRSARRPLAWLVGLYLLALALPLALFGWHGLALRGLPREALLADRQVAAQAGAHLRGMAGAFGVVRGVLAPPLWLVGRLGWLPGIGPTLGALHPLTDVGAALLEAGAAATPLLEALAAQPAEAPLTMRMATALGAPEVVPALGESRAAIQRAMVARAAMGAGPFPGLGAPVALLDLALPPAKAMAEAAPILPWLLGNDTPRHYLLLAQNSDELRATGGFITGIGLMTLDRGALTHLDFQDSIEVDNWTVPHPEPPAPFTRYMGIDLWVTRDANWSPDFPTAAQQVASLYTTDTGQRVDGVIAADMEALALLVEGVGELALPERGLAVSGETVLPTIEALWAPPGGVAPPADVRQWSQAQSRWWHQRKSFMPDLLQALMKRVQGSPQELEPLKVLANWPRALDEKHLQLFFFQAEAQRWALGQGWGGATTPPGLGDYLMVVESNMGYNKANRAVARTLDYQVALGATGAEASLTLAYQHPLDGPPDCTQRIEYAATYQAMAARCYRSYVRVYAPLGAELQSSSGLADVESWEEGAYTVIGGFLALPPATEKAVRLRYTLPASVAGGEGYSLFVQKQAGLTELPLQVTVTAAESGQIVFQQQLRVQRDMHLRPFDPQ